MKEIRNITIDLDKISAIATYGIRRTSVFMALGVSAARDDRLKEYQLNNLVMFQAMPDNADDQTLAKFKNAFHQWIISNGLRELVETFATFLDRIYEVCFISAKSKGELKDQNIGIKKFEKKGLAGKLELLRNEFSVITDREKYLNSINRARHCITHRQGRVGQADIKDQGVFNLVWLGFEIYADTTDGQKIPIMPPYAPDGIILEEANTVKLHVIDREVKYKLGEIIQFTPNDLGEICLLFSLARADIMKSVFKYLKHIGIEIQNKTKS